MDYKKHYNLLVEKSKSREIFGYYENHHILPKCMGGGDNLENITSLKPEEHFLAHQLLVKIYPHVPSLVMACHMMSENTGKRNRHNNKSYGWIRRKASLFMRDNVRDRWAKKRGFDDYLDQCETFWVMYVDEMKTPADICSKFSINNLDSVSVCLNIYASMSGKNDELKKSRFNHRSKNSKLVRDNITPEQEKRRIEAIQKANLNLSDKEKTRRSDWMKTVNLTKDKTPNQVSCPWCEKVGGNNVMKRWHFDNCKHKKGIV